MNQENCWSRNLSSDHSLPHCAKLRSIFPFSAIKSIILPFSSPDVDSDKQCILNRSCPRVLRVLSVFLIASRLD